MTKYIIGSGGMSKYPNKFNIFIKELISGLNNNPKILLCFFAVQREDWESRYLEKKEALVKSINKDINPSFDLAMPDIFMEQVHKADAIIIYGGDDNLIQYWLKQFNLSKIWNNKTIATSSASSNALVKYFWTCDWRKNMDGLGIIPIKFIPHYKSDYGSNNLRGPIDWNKAYRELKNYKEDLPIHALEEGDFIVIRQ